MLDLGWDFAQSVGRSHQRVTVVDVWRAGVLIASDIPVRSGSVSVDGDATVRTSLKLSVVDRDGTWVPRAADAALAPYGSELHVRSGLVTPSGTRVLASMGWFVITNVTWRERARYINAKGTPGQPGYRDAQWVNSGALIDIDAEDRMVRIRRYALMSKVNVGGASSRDWLFYLVVPVPGINIRSLPATGPPIPVDTVLDSAEGSRLSALQTVLPEGWAMWFDRDGNFNAGVIPTVDVTTPPAQVITVGPQGTVLSVQHNLSAEDIHNAVVTRGQNSSDQNVIQGTAYEYDGPLAWSGPFGPAPTFRGGIPQTSQAALDAAAATYLDKEIRGRDRVISVEVPPDARIEYGDLIQVRMPFSTFTGRMVASDFPLTAGDGPQRIDLRVEDDAIQWAATATYVSASAFTLAQPELLTHLHHIEPGHIEPTHSKPTDTTSADPELVR